MKYFSVLILVCFFGSLNAQVAYSETNFRAPMNIKMVLAGNFAEMRSNHFHTGLDIKTNHKEGYRIYAIDSGYVSRINYSHWGYGRAIYVTHPNGYTSVYAHLSKFPKDIEKYVRKKQFENQKETFQVYPGKDRFVVSKGDIIAYSGNSGSSTAPHLHFEIRETESENPVNPLLFHFDIADTKKPILLDVKLYPMNGAKINGKRIPYNIDLKGSNGVYKREYNAPININGDFGCAINTIDLLDGAGNKCGIFSIELQVDDKTVFVQELEKLDFSTNRYINTHSDYLEYRLNKQSYHKSFVSANNKLDIYKTINGNGYIHFEDEETHKLTYIIKDTYGNTSSVNFTVNAKLPYVHIEKTEAENQIIANRKNTISKDGFEAVLPSNTVYEDLKYELKTGSSKLAVSPMYQFHNDHTPVQKYFVLKLKTANVSQNMEDKALIVEVSKNRRRVYAKGGTFKEGWVETEVRSFGDYTVRIDSTAPVITPVNITDGKNMSKNSSIILTIADNLSGIETYDVFVDGVWKLAKYVPRKKTLTLSFDSYNKIAKGKHTLKVVVTDERKNQSTLEIGFVR